MNVERSSSNSIQSMPAQFQFLNQTQPWYVWQPGHFHLGNVGVNCSCKQCLDQQDLSMQTSAKSANTDEIRCPLPLCPSSPSKAAAKRSPAMTTCVLGMLAFGVSWHGVQPPQVQRHVLVSCASVTVWTSMSVWALVCMSLPTRVATANPLR